MTPPLPDLAAERLDALLDAERENTALRAEVSRLRVIHSDLRRMVDGLETAAHEERAAVVAWLREVRDTSETAYASDDLDYAIAVIERGEHRREEAP